jgi:hypothetical protein
MAQKKMSLPSTSVNGSVMLALPHVPVSAFNLVDATVMTITATISMIALVRIRVFI